MYFALLKFFKYGNFDALPQLGNNHNLDPKSIIVKLKKETHKNLFSHTYTLSQFYNNVKLKWENT
jgi:hypothetical protein